MSARNTGLRTAVVYIMTLSEEPLRSEMMDRYEFKKALVRRHYRASLQVSENWGEVVDALRRLTDRNEVARNEFRKASDELEFAETEVEYWLEQAMEVFTYEEWTSEDALAERTTYRCMSCGTAIGWGRGYCSDMCADGRDRWGNVVEGATGPVRPTI